ncbi:MAG: hypothetical protein AAGH68_00295 [Pseudomonadota bacterium]
MDLSASDGSLKDYFFVQLNCSVLIAERTGRVHKPTEHIVPDFHAGILVFEHDFQIVCC